MKKSFTPLLQTNDINQFQPELQQRIRLNMRKYIGEAQASELSMKKILGFACSLHMIQTAQAGSFEALTN